MSICIVPRAAASVLVPTIAAALVVTPAAHAQWSTTYDQTYYPGEFNWQFRRYYPAADRLFNAFDFGHAILYETLWSKPEVAVPELEGKWYRRLTREILLHPPRLPLEEGAVEIGYAKLAPEAKQMFDWAHVFHRQVYDVWADERIPLARKDAEVARLIAYYRSRPDIAFSTKPKSMELMQEQPYSLAFRQNFPKFNGLIWAYHWLQVGLYEPLVTGRDVDERQAGVRLALARFWQMLDDPPRTMPYVMPMTAAVAPTFAARYPEAAIIFDNLHSMHDVVSDILANPSVPRDRKRAEIMRAVQLFRDDTSFVMPVEAWRTMAGEMGIENMGGPAVGFEADLPTPTVTRGAVMEHDEQTGEMTGMKVGEMTGAHDSTAAGHSPEHQDSTRDTARSDTTRPPMQHAPMHHGGGLTDSAAMHHMMEMHMRMMADPVIRRRMMADTTMRRMMLEMTPHLPAEHRERMMRMMRDTTNAQPPPRPGPPAQRPPEHRHPPTASSAATSRVIVWARLQGSGERRTKTKEVREG